MFVVWNPDRRVRPLVWRPQRWCSPGGARWRCRQVLVTEDVQPLNVGAVPCVTRPDILVNQGAQCVEREVVGSGFARRQSCAEGVRRSAEWAGMQLREAQAAEPVHLLGAAAAEFMFKEWGVVVVDRYRSWDNQVNVRECARFCAVRCGRWCNGSFPGVAVVSVCVANRWVARVGNG